MEIVYDDQGNRSRLTILAEKGVKVWGPERVYVSSEVSLNQIAPGATLMNAVVSGSTTSIGSGAQIGTSGMARIHEAKIGRSVVLGAGIYENCILLQGAKARGFAEFRQGTVLEEDAETGHNVALKNTFMTVGSVAGSSINFCDVLLSGGSSRKDHSEVGSGVVHFNFDPRGDKYGSLLGDATGCLLRSRRVFVGGNSGIVAPVHLQFGVVLAAGSTLRHSLPENTLSGGDATVIERGYDFDRYSDLTRKFIITAKLVGNLRALCAWYRQVRQLCADSDVRVLYEAAEQEIDRHVKTRAKEVSQVISRLDTSLSKPRITEDDRKFDAQHRKLIANRERINSLLMQEPDASAPSILLTEYARNRRDQEHAEAVRRLSPEASEEAGRWIREIAGRPVSYMTDVFS
jgi:acetyltransferase-like isoleucine patch superfamily enzyme